MGRHRWTTDSTAEGGGVFGRIGRVVVRWPWLVIAAWIGLGIGLTQTFPPLAVLAQKASPSILPADAPSLVSSHQIAEAFREGGSDNILLVVLTDDNGLSPDDEVVYSRRVRELRAETDDVAGLQDFNHHTAVAGDPGQRGR